MPITAAGFVGSCFSLVAIVTVASCGASSPDAVPALDGSVVVDGRADDAEGGDDGSCPVAPAADRTFDPSTYDKTCSKDADCRYAFPVVPQYTNDCFMDDCKPVAVRATPQLAADELHLNRVCCLGFLVTVTSSCPGEITAPACDNGQCVVVFVAKGDAGTDGGTDASIGDAAAD